MSIECSLPKASRIVVIGSSCSGKTTFARDLANRLGCRHIELDSIHWGPNWTPRTPDDVRTKIEHLTQADAWVSCGNYQYLRDIIWQRADTIVWLNYSFWVVAQRALRRTIVRSLRGDELWAGNRETLRMAFLSRDSILLWILKTYRRQRQGFPREFARPEHAHLKTVMLKHPKEAEEFLQHVPTPSSQS